MHVTPILRARRAAGITQHEIARAIGKTTMWLSLAERGLTPVSPEIEEHILTLVHRLSWLNETVARKREELVSDVRHAAAR